MSGEGIGVIAVIALATVAIVPIVLTIAAGGVLVGAVAGTVKLTQAIIDHRRRREAERQQAMARALETVSGSIGEMARKSHEHINTQIAKIHADDDRQREALQKERAELSAQLQNIQGNLQDQMIELSQRTIDRLKKEEERTNDILNQNKEKSRDMLEKSKLQIAQEFAVMTAEVEKQIMVLEATLQEKQLRSMQYAMDTYNGASQLHEVLRHAYDCEQWAPGREQSLSSLKKKAQEALEEKQYDVMIAVSNRYANEAQRMQVEIEVAMAENNRHMEMLEVEMCQLSAMAEASHGCGIEKNTAQSIEITGENPDMNYWSEGRLQLCWDTVIKLESEVEAAKQVTGPLLGLVPLIQQIVKVKKELERAHVYARQAMISSYARKEAIQKLVAAQAENGFHCSKAEYEMGDKRKPVRLSFEKKEGQNVVAEDILIIPEYDPDTGLFSDVIRTFRTDSNGVNEEIREGDRTKRTHSLSKKGIAYNESCNTATRGKNMRMPQKGR